MAEINHVLAVGAGVMGHGFAQTFALEGLRVSLVDNEAVLLERAWGWIRENPKFMLQSTLLGRAEVEVVLGRTRFGLAP